MNDNLLEQLAILLVVALAILPPLANANEVYYLKYSALTPSTTQRACTYSNGVETITTYIEAGEICPIMIER